MWRQPVRIRYGPPISREDNGIMKLYLLEPSRRQFRDNVGVTGSSPVGSTKIIGTMSLPAGPLRPSYSEASRQGGNRSRLCRGSSISKLKSGFESGTVHPVGERDTGHVGYFADYKNKVPTRGTRGFVKGRRTKPE